MRLGGHGRQHGARKAARRERGVSRAHVTPISNKDTHGVLCCAQWPVGRRKQEKLTILVSQARPARSRAEPLSTATPSSVHVARCLPNRPIPTGRHALLSPPRRMRGLVLRSDSGRRYAGACGGLLPIHRAQARAFREMVTWRTPSPRPAACGTFRRVCYACRREIMSAIAEAVWTYL